MKSIKYAAYLLSLLFLIGFATSCSEDTEDVDAMPSLTFDATNSTSEITVGAKVIIKATVVASAKLEKIEVLLNNAVKATKTSGFKSSTGDDYTFEYQSEASDAGKSLTFTVKVTDKKNRSNSKDFVVTVKPATTPLSADVNFEFKRLCGAAATGLDTYGLTWTSNSNDGFVVMKKGADKFVELAATDYAAITTKEALKAKVDAGTDITGEYKKVKTDATADYNLVIATKKGDVYYILNIKKATVSTCDGGGTTISITGVSKS
ncbi:MAG: hypothetical protein OHK0038_08790 [Flammeovirgaceae bacterium]